MAWMHESVWPGVIETDVGIMEIFLFPLGPSSACILCHTELYISSSTQTKGSSFS